MNYKNEIAIELTKKLEHEIVFQFYNNRESPSYFNIRRTILDILDKYLEVFTINEKISPHTIKETIYIISLKKKLHTSLREFLKEMIS